MLIIEGFVNQTGAKEDTFSRMGGLTILVATRDNNNSLSNIRRFGTTKSVLPNESINNYQEGSFSLKLKLKPNDVLLIGEPGDLYWGAVVVPIWKLTPK